MFNTLSRIALRYYLDSVTVILTAPSLQMYVIFLCHDEVTEQIVTQSRRLVEFTVSKWLKYDPLSPFYPTIWMKKATLQWENLQEVRKKSL